MNTALTPLYDAKLSDSALRTVAKMSQRSPTDIALLRSLWTNMADMLDYDISFFLRVPASQYDRESKTHIAPFHGAGALLTMPGDLARLVIHQVEGRIHKLAKNDLSDEQWDKVQNVGKRLAIQHPDHVTNVIRLWTKVLGMKGEEVQEMTVKDLGLLWQHRITEAVVILEKLEEQADHVKVEDMKLGDDEAEDEKVNDEFFVPLEQEEGDGENDDWDVE